MGLLARMAAISHENVLYGGSISKDFDSNLRSLSLAIVEFLANLMQAQEHDSHIADSGEGQVHVEMDLPRDFAQWKQ